MEDLPENKFMPRRTSFDANGRRRDYVEIPEDERKNLGRILRMARRAKRYTQAQVAVAAASTPQAIGYWEAGKTTTSPARLAAIGRFLDFDIEAAKNGEMRPAPKAEGIEVPPIPVPLPPLSVNTLTVDWMNLLGVEDVGAGAFVMKDPIARIRRPPGLRHAHEVAAINVATDTMHPRFKLGEVIYLQKRIVGYGDDAVLEVAPAAEDSKSRCHIVEIIALYQNVVVCRQHNPVREVRFARSHIKTIWRVLRTIDLLGF